MTGANPGELLEGKQLLIFDFDGTLADTSPLHEEAFNAVLSPWGIRVDYASIAGMRTKEALRSCFAKAGLDVLAAQCNDLAREKQNLVRQLVWRELRPLPGVDEFLRWAKVRYRLALCTSGSRGTVSVAMDSLGYSSWFDPMLCAEDVVHGKPNPEGLLKILAEVGADAADVLVFEDSWSGLEAARRAGLPSVDVRFMPFEKLQRDGA